MNFPRSAILVAWLLSVSLPVFAQPSATQEVRSPVPEDINEKFLDPKMQAQDWVQRFEVESREIFTTRNEIAKALHLQEGQEIADVGAGTGLFSSLFSKQVGESGKVFALDISPNLVAFMRKRFKEEGKGNVEVDLSKDRTIGLPEGSVDTVFICDTYHHFEYPHSMLASILKSLRPGGELVIVDFERIPGVSRDWVLGHVRAGKEEVKEEVCQAGFQFKEEVEIEGLHKNYLVRFEKK